MSDEKKDENQVRKTVSFTHKQLFTGAGGIVALTFSVSQLKDIKEFFIGDQNVVIAQLQQTVSTGFTEAKADNDRKISELKSLIMAQSEETQHRFERLADKMIDRIKDQDASQKRDIDRVEHRMDSFEASIFTKSAKSKN